MKTVTLAAVAFAVLGIGAVRAEPMAYTTTGMGTDQDHQRLPFMSAFCRLQTSYMAS